MATFLVAIMSLLLFWCDYPVPPNPKIAKFEIALQIDTGNTIYQEFSDLEEAQEFIQNYFSNPNEILDKITPKTKPHQTNFDDLLEDD